MSLKHEKKMKQVLKRVSEMQIEKIDSYRKQGLSVEAAAKKVGVNIGTYYAHKKKDKPKHVTITMPSDGDKLIVLVGPAKDVLTALERIK